jgi:hypothetical protein
MQLSEGGEEILAVCEWLSIWGIPLPSVDELVQLLPTQSGSKSTVAEEQRAPDPP